MALSRNFFFWLLIVGCEKKISKYCNRQLKTAMFVIRRKMRFDWMDVSSSIEKHGKINNRPNNIIPALKVI